MAVATQDERQGSRFDVAGRYARALFELAAQDAQLARVDQDIAALRAMIAASSDLMFALRDRTLEASMRNQALHQVFVRAELGELTRNFIGLVLHNGRGAQLADIARHFTALMAEHQKIAHIEIKTARELSAAQSQRLESICRAHFGNKAQIKLTLEPDLIGGLTLEMAGDMFDASLRGKLDQLEKNFKQTFHAN